MLIKITTTNHLVLLVKNEVGYENLMKIVSEASIEGFITSLELTMIT